MMTRRTTLITAAAFGASSLANAPIAAAASDRTYLVDFVILNDGATLQDRLDYEALISPIIKKYDMTVKEGFNLAAHLNGALKDAVRLTIWEMPDTSVVQKVFEDVEYNSHVEQRNKVHKMSDIGLYFAKEKMHSSATPAAALLVDLVVMSPGFGDAERDDYETRIAPIAARHGLTLFASYVILQKVNGVGPGSPLRLNLWNVSEPEGMKALGQDPDYVALADLRNKIHDFAQLTLFMAQQGE